MFGHDSILRSTIVRSRCLEAVLEEYGFETECSNTPIVSSSWSLRSFFVMWLLLIDITKYKTLSYWLDGGWGSSVALVLINLTLFGSSFVLMGAVATCKSFDGSFINSWIPFWDFTPRTIENRTNLYGQYKSKFAIVSCWTESTR